MWAGETTVVILKKHAVLPITSSHLPWAVCIQRSAYKYFVVYYPFLIPIKRRLLSYVDAALAVIVDSWRLFVSIGACSTHALSFRPSFIEWGWWVTGSWEHPIFPSGLMQILMDWLVQLTLIKLNMLARMWGWIFPSMKCENDFCAVLWVIALPLNMSS